ncbi:exopolygalacturonase-like [Cynara cardunculus var. scolymus]|uniref:exopolygalacturonase-like n=1 Tax=Cynara cardunculus var. scolymus TaxID=59895 RepID=UPI000D626270|nr:exopolygalacturonase-like [Cynara cardunculus var. scolymus]
MGKERWSQRAVCCLLLMALMARNHAAVVDVKTKGAKGDGKTNDGPAIVDAWKAACAGPPPSSVLFPPGIYMAFPPIDLMGPCKGPIEFKATGATIKAPPELAKFKTDAWIWFTKVDSLTMTGGTYDGQGQETWKNNKCSTSGTCSLPSTIKLSFVKNALVKDVTSANAKFFHMFIVDCENTRLDHVTIDAPGNSVNTDGIHVGRVSGVNITDTNIKTGDDCISFGDGSKNVHVERVTCGPGHGISIGSLGRYPNEAPVAGIWIKNCTFTGTLNGVRIKTWPGGTPGTASDMHFDDIIMTNVGTPILIDQLYCPYSPCQKGPSKVKISNVSFRKIRGSSSTKIAIRLACSPGLPCDNVEVADINLTFKGPGGPATSECSSVKPKVVGQVVPPACPGGPK